jgi:outer membrane lipoprotein SlyB
MVGMMGSTPLGRYGPLVASATAGLAVLAYLTGALFGGAIGTTPGDLAGLKEIALIALGAVFGSTVGAAVSTNGLQRDVVAAHHRLDKANVPPADEPIAPSPGD